MEDNTEGEGVFRGEMGMCFHTPKVEPIYKGGFFEFRRYNLKLSYQLARRLQAFKKKKREMEAIERDILHFQSLSLYEKEEELLFIGAKAFRFIRNEENSSRSVEEKDQRNRIQRKYRAKLKERKKRSGEIRKPIDARFPIVVKKIRIPSDENR